MPAVSSGALLAELMKSSFQVAYVTTDIIRARSALQDMFDVTEFETLDVSLDVVGQEGVKASEVKILASLAVDRSLEIIEPVDDPAHLFGGSPGNAQPLLTFHHVGTFVADLKPALAAADDKAVPYIELTSPVMDVAFIDLRSFAGHWLEVLCPRAQ